MDVDPDQTGEIPAHLEPTVWLEKLTGYCLNTEATSTGGNHKARLFRSILDLGAEDAEAVREQLLEGVWRGRITDIGATKWGTRYQVEISIMGNNDKTAKADTVWQVEPDGSLKFVTVRTIEKDR